MHVCERIVGISALGFCSQLCGPGEKWAGGGGGYLVCSAHFQRGVLKGFSAAPSRGAIKIGRHHFKAVKTEPLSAEEAFCSASQFQVLRAV